MLDVSDWKDYVEDSVQTLESDVRKVHGTPSLPHSRQPTSTTTSQWFHLSMPSRKKAWQPSELAWCRKWDREENKKMSRKDQQHQLCSVSTKLKKGEAEDVWTTRWRTRNCWSPLLHERSPDAWRYEITYSTMKRKHGTENCSGYKKRIHLTEL